MTAARQSTSPRWRHGAIALAILLGALVVAIAVTATPVGLTASVLPLTGSANATPEHVVLDTEISRSSVARLAGVSTAPTRIRWDGFFYSANESDLELVVVAGGAVRIWIDGRLAAEREQARHVGAVSALTSLARGQHMLTLEYERGDASPSFQLQWNRPSHDALRVVPVDEFSPRSLSDAAWRGRRWVASLLAATCAVWLLLASVLIWSGIRRSLGAVGPLLGERWLVCSGALIALFAAGLWWGLPGASWALDEIGPEEVIRALDRRFSNGWSDKYPPLHFQVLSLSYAPVLAANAFDLVGLNTERARGLLQVQGRLVSLIMGLGAVTFIGALAGRLTDRRNAALAALLAGLFVPFAFYAKLANLDVPYLFWFALSLLFLESAHRLGRVRDFVALGASAACCVATKDQAYGLYILPLLHLTITTLRSGRGPKGLAAGAIAGLAVFAAVHNVVFNGEGFRQHIEALVGPASSGYRMYSPTPSGMAALSVTVGRLTIWSLGAAGLVATALGLTAARSAGASRPLPLWLALAPVSYCLTFLAVVGYAYDRFLLPVAIVLAVPAAAGVRRLLDGWPRPPLGRAAATLLIGWLVWRAASVNVMMITDSRYAAEAWMQQHIPKGASVATAMQEVYLPRRAVPGYIGITPDISSTLDTLPDFVVLNTEYMNRHPPDSSAARWLRWLESGDGPYVEVYRYKRPHPWSALRWDARFSDRVENVFTNLDKINPEVAIFRRRP